MVKRIDMSRPRVRLQEGQDPTAAIERLYGSGQLDKGGGLVKVNRHGELPNGAGIKKLQPTYYEVQDRNSGPAPGADLKVNQRSWQHGGGDATRQPNFDHSKPRRGR